MQHILSAIHSRLASDAALTSLVGTRVYLIAPQPDAPLPYVVIVPSDFADVPATSVRAIVRGTVYVYGVTAGVTADGTTIADRIDALLHAWSSPPAVWASVRERIVFDVEEQQRRVVALRGGVYDIIASPA